MAYLRPRLQTGKHFRIMSFRKLMLEIVRRKITQHFRSILLR